MQRICLFWYINHRGLPHGCNGVSKLCWRDAHLWGLNTSIVDENSAGGREGGREGRREGRRERKGRRRGREEKEGGREGGEGIGVVSHHKYKLVHLQSKILPVSPSNAVVNPGAVVVKLLHTPVTLAAVLCTHRPHHLACVAHVVDWVVDVIVVAPCCWVANLFVWVNALCVLCVCVCMCVCGACTCVRAE